MSLWKSSAGARVTLNHAVARRLVSPATRLHSASTTTLFSTRPVTSGTPTSTHSPLAAAPNGQLSSTPRSPDTLSILRHGLRPYSSRSAPNQAAADSSSPPTSSPSASLTLPSTRHLFSRTRRKRPLQSRRTKTSFDHGSRSRPLAKPTSKVGDAAAASKTGPSAAQQQEGGKKMLEQLPNLHNFKRPTKEELLAAATGFWSRLRVRFKWFSIRSLRPFNMDDISAFFSWFLLGHLVWVIVGTTTFFSLLILAVNTVFAQETLAGWVGNYLTKSSGVKVIFESAIVPSWNDGVITFRNVFVSRRPGQKRSEVRKGSQTAAAAAAADLATERAAVAKAEEEEEEVEDTNYTQYDLSIETVNVTLSFTKWFNGHGLLRDVEVRGVRGVIDRTAVHYTGVPVDPRSYRHKSDTGDFELESFKMEDLLVSIYQPDAFRPFSVSIFSADLPQLRKQWLFYDFLAANHMSGSFDGSLFTIHPRQTHNYTSHRLAESAEDSGHSWKKQSRIRIDGLKIDHLNRGVEGPFSWIHEGNVDIVADILFPADTDESIVKVVSDMYDRVEAQVLQQRSIVGGGGAPAAAIQRQPEAIATPAPDGSIDNSDESAPTDPAAAIVASVPTAPAPSTPPPTKKEATRPPVIFDLNIHLSSVHAAVPIFTRELSYVNSALIRPIVAYINSHSGPSSSLAHNHPLSIPINCRVVKDLADFEGSWTVYDSGLMQDLSRETYEAFVRGVSDEDTRNRRIRKVGMWGIGVVVQALVLGIAGGIA